MENTVERLPKALKKVESLSAKLKEKLKTTKMCENMGQAEVRQLTEAIGSDLYARIGNEQVFIAVLDDFNQFVDNIG